MSVSVNKDGDRFKAKLYGLEERGEKKAGVVLSPVWFNKSHLEIIPLEFGRKSQSETIAQQTVWMKKIALN